jgi:hypothetical protein
MQFSSEGRRRFEAAIAQARGHRAAAAPIVEVGETLEQMCARRVAETLALRERQAELARNIRLRDQGYFFEDCSTCHRPGPCYLCREDYE